MVFHQRAVGIARISRFNGATPVVIRDINLTEELIGLWDRGNTSQAKLFDKTVLVSIKAPFDASFRLRAIGTGDLNTEFIHGASKLGHGLVVAKLFFNGGLAVDFVDGVLVDIEGDRTAPGQEVRLCGFHEVEGIFHGNEFGVQDLAGGVVDEDQEDERGARPSNQSWSEPST